MPPGTEIGRAHGLAVQPGINAQIIEEVQEAYAEVLLKGLIDYMRTDGGDFLRFAVAALLLTVRVVPGCAAVSGVDAATAWGLPLTV